MVLLIKGKVEVLAAYDSMVRTVSVHFQLPSVLRLCQRVRVAGRFHQVPFSRANVYYRDRHSCQYCFRKLLGSELTLDHVVPVSQGGRKEWENIVACCFECNRRKGGKTPEQAGLSLDRPPKRPAFLPALRINSGLGEVPESWQDYLSWHTD